MTNTTERDEIARVIHGAPVRIAWNGEQKIIADALFEAGYRKAEGTLKESEESTEYDYYENGIAQP